MTVLLVNLMANNTVTAPEANHIVTQLLPRTSDLRLLETTACCPVKVNVRTDCFAGQRNNDCSENDCVDVLYDCGNYVVTCGGNDGMRYAGNNNDDDDAAAADAEVEHESDSASSVWASV